MNIPEKMLEVLKQDGVVALATMGGEEPHLVNTWNSYVRISDDGRLLIPAGYMHLTQANVQKNNKVLLTLGSSKVAGKIGPGTGFLVKGTAVFQIFRLRFRQDEGEIRMGAGDVGCDHRLCHADLVA